MAVSRDQKTRRNRSIDFGRWLAACVSQMLSAVLTPAITRTVMLAITLAIACALATPAHGLKAISVAPDQDRIEVTSLGELLDNRGDSLQIETAADAGIVAGRMTVRASVPGSNPTWLAFALSNPTDKPIERWLTAERYTMFGSGAVWPDLDARRVEALTPSLGFVPERIKSDRADIFRLTVEPGQTITYVAELTGQRFARVYLWKPLDYEFKARDRQLFNGVLLGLTGLLAIFLTAVFAANHKAIFPSAALVAWCVLAFLTVDFGFFHKLFQLKVDDYAVYRAATEAAVAGSLLIFLNTFLRLHRAPSLVRMLLGLWVAGQLALIAVAVIDPRLASTFARVSFVAVGGIGALAVSILALRGEDRALSLVPTWMLLLVWVLAASMILTGRLSTEIAASGLIAGLVLIVVLIGFTVTQFAFRSLEPAYTTGLGSNDQQMSALAIEASGAGLFEWGVARNEVKLSPMVDNVLGLAAGTLSTKVPEFLKYVHEADRERLRLALGAVQGKQGGALSSEFRLRHADNSTRWFEVEAAGLPGADPRANRFVGLVRDITETKRAHERLIHNAVYCSLTGIPNRALFLDRLRHAMERARTDERLRPAVVLIDLDRFKSVNSLHGMPLGDSLLLTIARRLEHHVSRKDMLARIGSDKFAILFEDERQPQEFAREAEQIRRAIRAPIRINAQDIVVTGSLGIAIFDGTEDGDAGLLEAAEIAVSRAKQAGVDRIEIFRPDMRGTPPPGAKLAMDIERALEKGQIKLLYQPIIYLPTEELAGFEASVRLDHPELGSIDPTAVDLSAGDLVNRIWTQMLNRAAKDAARWQAELPRTERPLFVSFNVGHQGLFKPELGRELRRILDHGVLPKGSLQLEIAEALVMDNPEQSSQILEMLDGVGTELTLDGFGAGYTGLAYLSQMPFDTVKLDRDLVQAAGGGETAVAPAVRSLVALSLELGKKVVADGVEDPEAVAFLRGIGCVFAQGFYYGDPMPDKDVHQLLKLVRKAERNLEPNGLFRRSRRKAKRTGQEQASPAAVAAAAKSDAQRGRVKRLQHIEAQPPAAAAPQAFFPPVPDEAMGEPMHGAMPPAYQGASIEMAPHGEGQPHSDQFAGSFAAAPPNGHYPHMADQQVGADTPTGQHDFAPQSAMFGDFPDFGRDPIVDPAHTAPHMSTAAGYPGQFASSYGGPPTRAYDPSPPADSQGFGRPPLPTTVDADAMAILGAAMSGMPRQAATSNGYWDGNGAAGPGAGAPGAGANGQIAKALRAAGPVGAVHGASSASAPTRAIASAPRVRTARPPPDLSKLPPGLAASLAKLANTNQSTVNPLAGQARPEARPDARPDARPSSFPSLSTVIPDKE